MTILNKRYSILEMKRISSKNNDKHFFSKNFKTLMGITEILTYQHSLFIMNRDYFSQKKKMYDIFMFMEENDYENIWILNKEPFETKEEAKAFVRALQRFFNDKLTIEEKEIINNLSYPYPIKSNIIEFVDKNSSKFEIKYNNGYFEKIN